MPRTKPVGTLAVNAETSIAPASAIAVTAHPDPKNAGRGNADSDRAPKDHEQAKVSLQDIHF